MVREFTVTGISLENLIKRMNEAINENKMSKNVSTANIEGDKFVLTSKKMFATSRSIYKIYSENDKLTFIFDSEDIAAVHKPFLAISISVFKKVLTSLGATYVVDP